MIDERLAEFAAKYGLKGATGSGLSKKAKAKKGKKQKGLG
jgi:hypothetical protein